MKIESIKTYITVFESKVKYGFSYNLNSGLNIITGHNSSGKSTILSCIYYCLGMEQLLGGNRNFILDKSITREFDFDNKTYTINQSIAHLTISNNGRIATLTRIMKDHQNENKNKITITENEKESSYLLHTVGDHDRETGFYHWLTSFLNINLPKIYSETTDQIKHLYLQNIFPCALIEQTKGWSDFFAQMPSFGIKDARQKLMEFLLDLESLENEFKKDILDNTEKLLKIRWDKMYEKIESLSFDKNFILKGIFPDISKNNEKSLSSSFLCRMSNNKKSLISIDEEMNILSSQLALAITRIKEKKTLATPESIKESQERLQNEIALINRQIRTLNIEKISEDKKISNYYNSIENINIEIERLDSSLKLNSFLPEDKELPLCPLCDHELGVESRLNVSNTKINYKESISFLKSQRGLYTSYIDKNKNLNDKYNDISNFLANEISIKKNEIRNLRKDLSSFNDECLRTDIFNEITINQKLNDYKKLSNSFSRIKSDLIEMTTDFITIRKEKSDLKSSDERDSIKINNFAVKFKKLLSNDKFNYTSNHISYITIQNKPPSRLLPVVISGNDTQTVRLSSSASDFIRIQWAFYLTLLDISNNHPGFIVFDEPGQHAMNVESMVALLKYSILSKKQIIMCISKDTKEKSSTANLSKILQYLKGTEKYTLIDIDPDDQKCIRPR